MTRKSLFYTVLLSFALISCKNDPLNIDASGEQVELNFVNMDSTFVKADSMSFIKSHEDWKKSITEIYNYELGYCLHLPEVSGAETYQRVKLFVNDSYVVELEKEIEKTFPSKELGLVSSEVKEGFKRLKYHFPDQQLPKSVVYMNTLYASNVFCTEKEIGVGLERYLGADSKSIKALPEHEFYSWIKDAMDKKFLTRDVFAGWVSTHFMEEPKGTLIEQMIYWGKIIYITEAALPNIDKNLIMRYEPEDLVWAKDNELAFWEYLVNEKLLFKTEELNIINMLKEGPFTPGLPEKGPDRLGQYLGWQMVKQYVEGKGIPLKDLIDTPYNDILQNYEIE